MKAILAQLNKTPGVWGSLIAGRDGIVIASDFSVETPESQVGAIASQILVALDGALKRIKMGEFKRFIDWRQRKQAGADQRGPDDPDRADAPRRQHGHA